MSKVSQAAASTSIRPQNQRLKQVREALKMKQKEFAERLSIKQGTLSDIERGRISVSAKISDALIQNFDVNAGWLHTGVGDIFNYNLQGGNAGVMQGTVPKRDKKERKKLSYMHQFRQQILQDHKELFQLSDDVFEILGMDEVITSLNSTKIGDVLFFGVENLKKVSSFKEFKEIGLQVLNDALPYSKIVHDFAEACRKFVKELNLIKDEIEMDFDFEDYFWQENQEATNEEDQRKAESGKKALNKS